MTGGFMSDQEEKATKKGWKDLFFKPKTRDERVKDYIPEVLEESLAAQRAVLAHQNTERDLIVEHGQKMLKDLENKAPVTNMFSAFVALFKLYKQENLVSQRAMHLLMYPGSTQVGAVSQQAMPELVNSFAENLRNFIDTVEQKGSYVHDVKWKSSKKQQQQQQLEGKSPIQLEAAAAATAEGKSETKQDGEMNGQQQQQAVVDENGQPAAEKPKSQFQQENIEEPAAAPEEAEPLDVTLYVKCLAGMSMANARLNDTKTALRCCDAALEHVMDPNRKGGVFAMKAGLLVQSKKYIEAANAARMAIECAPNNAQGYLQGASALRLAGRPHEAVDLLKLGLENMPKNAAVAALLEKTEKIIEQQPKQLEESGATTIPASSAEKPKQVGA